MQKIQIRFILEVLGRPAEHVKEVTQGIVQRIANEKNIKIIEQEIHEPVPVKEAENLFTTFVEITAEIENLATYFGIIFTYFPSNIEIISPDKVVFNIKDINEIGAALVSRVHEYETVVKKLMHNTEILTKQLEQARPELFKNVQELSSPSNSQVKEVKNIPVKEKKPKKTKNKKTKN